MKHWLVIFIFLFSQLTFAQCPEDIQELQKGQVANCSGLLFSPDEAKRVIGTQNDVKYYKLLSEKLTLRADLTNKEISVLDKRLNIYIDQSYLLATQLHKKEKEDKWQKMIYFALGVFATGIAVHGASQLGR